MQDSIIQTVRQTVQKLDMLKNSDAVLAGVSGGPDSIALVLALVALREEYRLNIGVAHINHQLRGEDAQKDEAFVRNFADKAGMPFFLKQVDAAAFAEKNRLSLEDAGRKIRYDFFKQTARKQGYTKIATGHHKDDNAEQILINLLRGSGPKGLSGIPPVRDGFIVRPLIRVTKTEIKTFLASENQTFMEDSSNQDPRFLRNRIRHHLIPLLQSEYNPEIIDSLDRLSRILRQEELFFQERTQTALAECLISGNDDTRVLSREKLKGIDSALLGRVIRKAIKEVKSDLKRVSHLHIISITDFIEKSSGNSLDLPGQIRIYKNKDTVTVKKENRPLREIGRSLKASKRKKLKNQVPKS